MYFSVGLMCCCSVILVADDELVYEPRPEGQKMFSNGFQTLQKEGCELPGPKGSCFPKFDENSGLSSFDQPLLPFHKRALKIRFSKNIGRVVKHGKISRSHSYYIIKAFEKSIAEWRGFLASKRRFFTELEQLIEKEYITEKESECAAEQYFVSWLVAKRRIERNSRRGTS